MPGSLHQRQVEHHQAGHGDAGQPQPLRSAWPAQPTAGEPGQGDEQQAGHGVSHRLGGEGRRPGEHRGDRDAAAHADHGRGPGSHADRRAPPGAAARREARRRGGGRGVGAASGAAGTSGARRPGTTLRYELDGPVNRANEGIYSGPMKITARGGLPAAEPGGGAGARDDGLAGRRHPGRHHRRAAAGRGAAARDPAAGRRPGRLPGRDRRGLPAARRRGAGQRPPRGRDSGPRGLRAARRPAKRPAPAPLPQRWRARAEIDLSPGVPDLSGFPRAAWMRAERLVLEQASVADLGYGDPRGSQWLRTELAGWLARTRGLRADPGDIIVVTGVAQALALLARVLRARRRRDRGRRSGLARGPRRAGLLGPAPGACPGGRARAAGR